MPSRYLTLVLYRVQYSCPHFEIPLQREIKANDIQHQKKTKDYETRQQHQANGSRFRAP